MPLFGRKRVDDEEVVFPYDPAPPANVISREYDMFEYDMDDFRARLGLQDHPSQILTVSIVWTGKVEVRMMSRLRATGHILASVSSSP